MVNKFTSRKKKAEPAEREFSSKDFGHRDYFGKDFYFSLSGERESEGIRQFVLGFEVSIESGQVVKHCLAHNVYKAEVHLYKDDSFDYTERLGTRKVEVAEKFSATAASLIRKEHSIVESKVGIELQVRVFKDQLRQDQSRDEDSDLGLLVVEMSAPRTKRAFEEKVVRGIRSIMERARIT